MTSAYILIASILVLGGLLATLGDRMGTRVGKARLSLFNLRPRTTATVVTIITGGLISASTLGILFATSESLRDGIFELDNILKKLRSARREVSQLEDEKNRVEQQLEDARAEQIEVQKRLDETNRNFQQAQNQLKDVSAQLGVLRTEIKSLLGERQLLIQQRNQLNEQITQLQSQITQLKELVKKRDQEMLERDQAIQERDQAILKQDQTIQQREQELAEKDQAIKQFDRKIAERDKVIAQRETFLKQLEQELKELEQQLKQKERQLAERNKQLESQEKQLAFLKRELEILEQYYQNYQVLRQGNVALIRGQVLTSGVVRIVDPTAVNQAVDQLLSQANKTAVDITRASSSNSQEPLVQITQAQVDQLVQQIQDGRDYVVRILSAGNYVEGEKPIQVFADAALNEVVFKGGDILATISTNPSTMTNEQIRKRLDQLLAASEFRARRAGILGDIQVGDGRLTTLINFIEQLEKYGQPLNVKAIAQETAYTAGPLKMQLVASYNGEDVFKTIVN
ncbi:MAG: DUF3084 domain-containing protein [Moorea sp. SIO4G2]|uniref:DUF3084 domain-containing protein n=1 Tax=Moorena bouillonii PNG TaxID=568701 RepID=A0A1U7N316_9CYAN|nr:MULTISPECIES: DUF3084 domain-containing protein [Moorena]NEO61925.1 DUF3084 domain-containing protein [Moorena sp. SIO4G2]NEP27929.1 DUF3084 domain-containing protein [Moorena sp. SIO3I6]OLT60301.1 hypothetical protein BJP37_15975 [Moorena bouillonii PNG]